LRWFITDSCDFLDGLEEAGAEITNAAGSFQADYLDADDPDSSDYPIKRLLLKAKADALVVVDYYKHVDGTVVGVNKGPILSWAGRHRGRMLVAYDRDGSSWRGLKEHGARGCLSRPHNYHAYLTRDLPTATVVAASIRTIYWPDGKDASAAVDALKVAMSSSYPGYHGQKPFVAE